MQGDIADPDPAEQRCATSAIDVVVNFAAESHNSLAVLDPGLLLRARTCSARRRCSRPPARRRPALPPRLDVRGLRRPAARPDEVFTEESPYRPRTPYNASKAGGRPRRAGLLRDVRAAGHDHQLLQQLRAVPVPREGHPALRHDALDDEPLRCTRRRRTSASGCTCSTTAARSSSCSSAGGPARPTTSAPASRRRSRRSPTPCSSCTGKPESLKTIVPDRPGHDRRYLLDSSKIRRELGWRAEIGWEDGLPETIALVPDNRDWWEPLRDRAPVDEAAWQR